MDLAVPHGEVPPYVGLTCARLRWCCDLHRCPHPYDRDVQHGWPL